MKKRDDIIEKIILELEKGILNKKELYHIYQYIRGVINRKKE